MQAVELHTTLHNGIVTYEGNLLAPINVMQNRRLAVALACDRPASGATHD